jgi:cephalosporin hydroxylase
MRLIHRIKAVEKSIYRKLNVDRTCLPDHGGRQFEVQMWTISDFILKKLVPVVGVHPFPLNEISLMVSAVCRIQPSHIYEWGTNVGVSARIFYETVEYFKIDSEIHTIDLPDDVKHVEHPGRTRGALIKGIKKIRMHQGDGVTTALALWDAAGKQGKPLFFLDGDHSYESVNRELRRIGSHVGNASFLIHDTLFQSPEARYNTGPFLAVQDFLREAPDRYVRIDERLGLPGMTLLYPEEALTCSFSDVRDA